LRAPSVAVRGPVRHPLVAEQTATYADAVESVEINGGRRKEARALIDKIL